MKKALKWILLGIFAMIVVLLAIIPLVVPPIVKSVAEAKLAELGFPSFVSMKLGYCWRKGPELAGSLRLAVNGSPWNLQADFGAGFGEWHAHAVLPETAFSETEPTIRRLLERYPQKAVSNLVFSGSVALDAVVERTRETPVPVWSVRAPLRRVSASLMTPSGLVALSDFSATPGASGIAKRVDISPLFLRARSVNAVGLAFTNFTATVRATEKALMINEANVGFCGGRVSLYSVFLNTSNLNAGLTLFLDEVDAGEALSIVKGFHGEASGLLHGKVKLFVKEGGKAVRLSDAYLYSTPGDIGKIRMMDSSAFTDNLAMAGIDDATRANVANALTDLDYTVLKLDLRRGEERSATLSIRVDGTATRGKVTVPVCINLNINGELEQIVNVGLGYSDKLKGTSK